jgi:hypothetical protein
MNDAGIENKASVVLGYVSVPDHYCYGIFGSEPIWNTVCVGSLDVKLSNYEVKYYTDYNMGNKVSTFLAFYEISLADGRYTSELSDYSYNGVIVKTQHYMITDTVNIKKKIYCTDCRITPSDKKLFSFSIYNQGNIENWELK